MLNLLQECEGAKTIGISGHIRPDGDCVGSCMALYLYLRKAFPEAGITVYLEEQAKNFHHIAHIRDIVSGPIKEESFDVFFCLDSMPDRMGEAVPAFERAKKKINIDHHITNPGCGDVFYVDAGIGSCAELIYNLIPEEALDTDIAKALYIGMIHDTGVFQFSNTRPSTMLAAAKLMQYPIDFANLIQESFYEKSYKQTKLMAESILRSHMYLEGKCLISYVTLKDMAAFQANANDFTGTINRLKTVRGVECAVFMYETEPGGYQVSMRTSDRVDAAKIAAVFGGGGHVKAAGCSISGTPEEVIAKLLTEVSTQV